MLGIIRGAFYVVLLMGAVGTALYYFFLRGEFPEKPELAGDLVEHSLQHQDYWRTYSVYVPKSVIEKPPVLFAFHGSRSSGTRFQRLTSFEFERMADAKGFIVVYPDGFDQHWNDCRASAPYRANELDIDDVGFVRAMLIRLEDKYGADLENVFATGMSNGGQMAYRLAMEATSLVSGVAAIAASLPEEGNLDCTPSEQPVSVLIMNGTKDPVNPYEGGEAALYGIGSRGSIRPTEETAAYFRSLGNEDEKPSLSDSDAEQSVFHRTISKNGATSVMLVRVEGGGHTIPHPNSKYPALLGPTSKAFNGPEIIWAFFESLMEAPGTDEGGTLGNAE